jgi:hypothetical protein
MVRATAQTLSLIETYQSAGFSVLVSLFFYAGSTAAPDRAPIAVFIGIGAALAAIIILLFLMVPISREDLTYRSTSYYSGPFGGFGGYGAFGGFRRF